MPQTQLTFEERIYTKHIPQFDLPMPFQFVRGVYIQDGWDRTETISLTDAYNSISDYYNYLLENLILIDNVRRVGPPFTLQILDELFIGSTEQFPYTFPFHFFDNAILNLRKFKSQICSDVLDLTDTMFSIADFNINIQNILLFTDDILKQAVYLKTFTDLVNVLDESNLLLSLHFSVTEQMELNDTITKIITYFKQLSDSFTIDDTLTIIANTFATLESLLSFDDNLYKELSYYQILTDGLFLDDVLSFINDIQFALYDTLSLSDSLIKTSIYSQTLNESYTLIEQTIEFIHALSLNILEELFIGSVENFPYTFPFYFFGNAQLFISLNRKTLLSDNITLTDIGTLYRNVFVKLDDTISFIDIIKNIYQYYFSNSEKIILGCPDEFPYTFPFRFYNNAVMTFIYTTRPKMGDSITIDDTFSFVTDSYIFLEEQMPLIESIIHKISFSIQNSLNLIDTVKRTKIFTNIFAELLRIRDAYADDLPHVALVGRDLQVWYWFENETFNDKRLIGKVKRATVNVENEIDLYKETGKRVPTPRILSKTFKIALENFRSNIAFQQKVFENVRDALKAQSKMNLLIKSNVMGATQSLRLINAKITNVEGNITSDSVDVNVEFEAEEMDTK